MNQHGLFNQTTVTSKASRIDATQLMTPTNWVVSLLRRKNSANPRHTFILVEGIDQGGTGVLNRYDLVINETRNDLANIIIKRYDNIELSEMDEFTEALLRLDDNDDKLYFRSWSITCGLAITLDQNIQADTTKKISYHQLGKDAFSGSVEGHNCFTWAREKLNSLQDKDICVSEKWSDYIVAHPSLYLPAEPTSGNTTCAVM